MERRGFLQGLFGGIVGGGIVVAAKPEEVAAFAGPLVKDQPLTLDPAPKPTVVPAAGEHLYNAKGELVAIVTEVKLHTQRIDVTSAWDTNRTYIQGPQHIELRAECVGRFEVHLSGAWHLRGLA